MVRKVCIVWCVVLILGVLFIVFSVSMLHTIENNKPVRIPKGVSTIRISEILDSSDVLSNPLVFVLYGKLSGKAATLQSGLYQFPDTLSLLDVLRILSEGSHQVEYRVTIPEGVTISTLASIFQKRAHLDSSRIIQLTHNKSFLDSLHIKASSLEGYLLPETYFVRPETTERSVLFMMAKHMNAVLGNEVKERRVHGLTKHELLTLASIVEAETSLDDERPRVAGVYYNRLRIGMRLQADPTIQYIIGSSPRRLLYRDLRINSPYNTYMYSGLPPGPINNPGRKSIHAALHPEKHNYLYFVANGKGGHVFSIDASQHQYAVQRYRMERSSQEK